MTLKDTLFQDSIVREFGERIRRHHSSFQTDAFFLDCKTAFPQLELKDRMNHVADMLHMYIDLDVPSTFELFSSVLNEIDESRFVYGSISRYVEVHGCNDTYVDLAISKLGEFTSAFTSEFAIRSFLNEYPTKTMNAVMEWAQSDNEHKRRLASEGTRPSLPWATKISVDYTEAMKPLEYLYYDTSRYVTRSVSNHLNDISKMDPELVLDTLKRWKDSNKQTESEMSYMIHHSLRTLIKKGYPKALEYIGYEQNPAISVSELNISPNQLHIGDTLSFEITLVPKQDCRLLLDYTITYPTKHGRTTKKVYKWKTLDAKKNQEYRLSGRRSFKHISTRTMKPGEHEICIQINGKIYQKTTFMLYE